MTEWVRGVMERGRNAAIARINWPGHDRAASDIVCVMELCLDFSLENSDLVIDIRHFLAQAVHKDLELRFRVLRLRKKTVFCPTFLFKMRAMRCKRVLQGDQTLFLPFLLCFCQIH